MLRIHRCSSCAPKPVASLVRSSLQAADADADSWADVASHCKSALAAVSSSDSKPGEMEQSVEQTRKRLRIYFVHFRRLCDSTRLGSLDAIRTFPNPVEESSKRTWETAVYQWRRLHTQPCGSGMLGLNYRTLYAPQLCSQDCMRQRLYF